MNCNNINDCNNNQQCNLNKETNLVCYLADLITKCSDMSIYLVNGIRLDGTILGYDKSANCIWLCNAINQNKPQIIFLNSVSTISFAKPVLAKPATAQPAQPVY